MDSKMQTVPTLQYPAAIQLHRLSAARTWAIWALADCDGDGVTNGDEIDPDGDGATNPGATDPLGSPVVLILADVSVMATSTGDLRW
jgi:hypothetical protein